MSVWIGKRIEDEGERDVACNRERERERGKDLRRQRKERE